MIYKDYLQNSYNMNFFLESVLDCLPCFLLETSDTVKVINRPVFEILGHTPPPCQEIRKNIYDATKLKLWEEFINDGKEIIYIAQLLECNYKYKGFPTDAIEYIEYKLGKNLEIFYLDENLIHEKDNLRLKYVEEFIQILFQHHASIYNLRLYNTIKKWLDKFEKVFPDIQPIKNLLADSEWQWEE
jgi:hypothetical protein